jgi:hypothetical protein
MSIISHGHGTSIKDGLSSPFFSLRRRIGRPFPCSMLSRTHGAKAPRTTNARGLRLTRSSTEPRSRSEAIGCSSGWNHAPAWYEHFDHSPSAVRQIQRFVASAEPVVRKTVRVPGQVETERNSAYGLTWGDCAYISARESR